MIVNKICLGSLRLVTFVGLCDVCAVVLAMGMFVIVGSMKDSV